VVQTKRQPNGKTIRPASAIAIRGTYSDLRGAQEASHHARHSHWPLHCSSRVSFLWGPGAQIQSSPWSGVRVEALKEDLDPGGLHTCTCRRLPPQNARMVPYGRAASANTRARLSHRQTVWNDGDASRILLHSQQVQSQSSPVKSSEPAEGEAGMRVQALRYCGISPNSPPACGTSAIHGGSERP